ncbi:MAG: hypothetical protein KBD76_08385 [Bacteriovorax sp.]|jgi:hypothetical protein|nr:hypothetical protein [Bacteriovorax sp.]
MNKHLIIYFLLCFTITLQAQSNDLSVQKILGSKELPLELNLLLESYQSNNDLEVLTTKTLMPIVQNIDHFARFISADHIFMIAKIEIYKTLLKTTAISPKAFINGDSLLTLQAAIKKASSPFTLWFLRALLRDSQNLLSSSLYKEYLLQKNNGNLEKREYKKIDKKVQLLYRWISKINTSSMDSLDNLENELRILSLECLKSIEQSFYLMAQSSSNANILATNKTKEELKFFSLKEIKKDKKVIKQSKSVDEILAPLTGAQQENSPSLPEPSPEDWTQEENTPQNLKNLPKPSNDADWLQDF